MIVNNISEAKPFVPFINLTETNNRFTDFFRRAQKWVVSKVIGTDVESLLEATVQNPDTHADLRLMCQRVIAEKAMLDAVPEMDLQLTEAGFAVQNNDNFSPASSQRVDRLIAKLQFHVKSDADLLVDYLIDHSGEQEPYAVWRGSAQFTRLTAAFMPLSAYVELCPGISIESYDQYYNLLQPMARGLDEVGDYYVSLAEIERLRELYRDDEMLEIHRKAVTELRVVAVNAASGNIPAARVAAARARDVMMGDPDSFSEFKNSSAYTLPSINLDGGKTVNFC